MYIPQEEIDKHYQAQLSQFDACLQKYIQDCYEARAAEWSRDFSSLEAYGKSVEPMRQLYRELIQPQDCDIPLYPILDNPVQEDGYSVRRFQVEALPEVTVGGVLCVPTSPKGPKPAVVMLHGSDSSAEEICCLTDHQAEHPFKDTALQLVQHGYVVLAPTLIRTVRDRIRANWKAMLSGRSFLGLETRRIRRCVDFLETLSDVASGQIAVYGHGWGGFLALATSPIEPRFRVSLVSGAFTERTKVLTHESAMDGPGEALPGDPDYRCYLARGRGDMCLPNFLRFFSDADLASLICPRPILIQAGDRDADMFVEWVSQEFSKLKSIYEKLGIPERAKIDVFSGSHEANAGSALDFIELFLKDKASL